MKRREGLAYLVQCADRNGNHWSGRYGIKYTLDDCPTCHGTNKAKWVYVPCSRYGTTSRECAFVAWRVAYLVSRETGEPITLDHLDHAMSMVVNDHEDVAYIVRQYGNYHYT